jgi:release factor-specific protein-(glutamine-N5) methyltransferase
VTDDVETRLAALGIADAAHEAARIAKTTSDRERIEEILGARAAGVPLGHILGSEEWLGIEIEVSPDVLAPRKETELLGRTAIRLLEGVDEPTVIDMCCGSGNLGCAIAHHVAGSRVFACDLTDSCVALTRQNAKRLGLGVTVFQGDLFAGLDGQDLEGNVDLVVCNPPYISTGRLEKDRATLLDHEPRAAFDGGPYGLTIQQRVIREAPAFVRPGGALAFEIGEGQARQISALFQRAKAVWTDVELVNDERGEPRVAVARRTDSAPSPTGGV